ncbi:MAG: type I methionyl aminopeptidase [Candidatus Tectomicrobia bacterium]|uniref:Methionine aminopeptidase n=1 Tax=Tectimicrobiota bacterium TaxID=2528274 RepID=A0A932HY83_UNCTE|nr:type I methionyl aminopeptidase [Candidatus Tectomicrobia bacterium]
MAIMLRSPEEVEKLRASNRAVALVMKELRKVVKAGVTTLELDALAEKLLLDMGAKPAFKGYRGYRHTICASVNEEVVHGIPSKRKLKEGDIISIDIGAKLNGYYGDHAATLPVGQVSGAARRLIRCCEQALVRGIEKARSGNRLFDISHAIQAHAEEAGFSVVRAYVGHGIGTNLHEEPQVPNFGDPGTGPELKPGMVLAIEPMLNAGVADVKVLGDEWTVVTADSKLSAHFEHTLAISDDGPDVLSLAS